MPSKAPQSVPSIPSAPPSSNKPAPVRRSARTKDSNGLTPKRSAGERTTPKPSAAAAPANTGPTNPSIGCVPQKPQQRIPQKPLQKPRTVLPAVIPAPQSSIASEADPALQTCHPAAGSQATSPNQTVHPTEPASPSKQFRLIELLHQPAGVSLADLMQATGWQAHSVRGVISGVLRKRLGFVVICQAGEDGKRIYRIKPAVNTAATDSAEIAK